MKLELCSGEYSVFKLKNRSSIPETVYSKSFFSITKTPEELSLVCESGLISDYLKEEANFVLIKIIGPLDFSLTGVLSSLTEPLAEKKISVFAISTFDTDYLLVKKDRLPQTIESLEAKGFSFV